MRFVTSIVLALLARGIGASVVGYSCHDDDTCIEAARHSPAKDAGCSSFFRSTVTPKVVTATTHTTVTIFTWRTITDREETVTTTVRPLTTTTPTTVTVTESSSTTTTTTTTTIVTPIATVPATTTQTDTATTTVSTQTITVPAVITSVVPKRGYPAPSSCPTTAAYGGASTLPAYARTCHNTLAYSSACSCLGVRHSTTTVAACTTTSTVTDGTCTRTATTHTCYTTTVTVTKPRVRTATATTTTTTVSTSSSTTTDTLSDIITITTGLVTSTTTTTSSVTTTTTTTGAANPLCSPINDNFQLELTGATQPVTQKVMFTGQPGSSPAPLLITSITSNVVTAEFSLAADGKLQTGGQSPPTSILISPSAVPAYLQAGPVAVNATSVYCSFGTPNLSCQYPLSCNTGGSSSGTAGFIYCTADTASGRSEGLALGDTVSPPTGCSPVTADGIYFVDNVP